MEKWEYKIVVIGRNLDALLYELNQEGKEGWELVVFLWPRWYIFKRRRQD